MVGSHRSTRRGACGGASGHCGEHHRCAPSPSARGIKAPLRCSDCSSNYCADAADGRHAANGGNPYLAGGVSTADEHHYPSILRTIDADANVTTDAAAEVHSLFPTHTADSTTPLIARVGLGQKGAPVHCQAPVDPDACDFRGCGFRSWDAT
jgi:hypothetical protein